MVKDGASREEILTEVEKELLEIKGRIAYHLPWEECWDLHMYWSRITLIALLKAGVDTHNALDMAYQQWFSHPRSLGEDEIRELKELFPEHFVGKDC